MSPGDLPGSFRPFYFSGDVRILVLLRSPICCPCSCRRQGALPGMWASHLGRDVRGVAALGGCRNGCRGEGPQGGRGVGAMRAAASMARMAAGTAHCQAGDGAVWLTLLGTAWAVDGTLASTHTVRRPV